MKLNISADDNSLDYDLALSVAPHFRLPEEKARTILETTRKVVSGWDKVAEKLGISRNERELIAPAFRHAN